VLTFHTNAMIDGDEAMVGIQAERILQGQFPTYFYGQAYMGSLETYIAAAIFAVFGPSNWALRAVPILLSPLLAYLTWRLARSLLPRDARTSPLLAGLAALIAAVPPVYDAVTELRTWGGQIEIYIITLALLVATVELADRLRAGARLRFLALRWLILGFIAGLGFWINPLISYAFVTCGLWLLPPLLARAFPAFWARLWRRPDPVTNFPTAADSADESRLLSYFPRTDARGREALAVALFALPGALIGGLPAWIYALNNGAANIMVYLSQPTVSPAVSGAARHGRLFLGAAITARYFTCVGPRVLDGALPTEGFTWQILRIALLIPPLLAIGGAFWLSRYSAPTTIRSGLPLLYAVVITLVFCLGTSAWPSTKQCSYDQAGRYAVPLALVEPLLLLAFFAVPPILSVLRERFGRPPQAFSAAGLQRGWSFALVVLLLFVGAQAAIYPLVPADTTFQSPFYRYVPLNDTELLAYLKANDIHAAWCNHWVGNIVTFQTDGQTTCADYYDQIVRGGIHRPPGTLETVSADPNPSFILILTEPHPVLAQELDAMQIPYTMAILKQSGVTVITPHTRVDPATVIGGISEDYGINAQR
ncbi:MAG TPA: hypothetical protein VMV29_13070, partial [Ktedonobacterales bacterium]|nr:hypothetical protein [Ktedonobacterales bacterium]